MTTSIDPNAAVKRVIDPLTRATESLLKPLRISELDRLHITYSQESPGGTQKGQLYEYFVLQAFREDEHGNSTAPSFDAGNRFFDLFPSARRLGYGRYRVDATDFSSLIIHSHWPAEQCQFDDEAKPRHDYNVLRFFAQTSAAQVRANFKINGEVPDASNLVYNRDMPLGNHQIVAVATCVGQPCSALFMEQGTGKTYCAISRIETEAVLLRQKLEESGDPLRTYKVLIICPKNVRTNWVSEFRQFGTLQRRVNQMRGPKLKRADAIVSTVQMDEGDMYSVCVCSYESVEGTWDFIKMLDWDLVIWDESHYIKAPKTNRTKQSMHLRNHSRARMLLTGTPIANGVQDLYAQLEVLDHGLSGFNTHEDFRSFHTKYDESQKNDSGVRRVVGFKNVPLLQERLARVSYMLTTEEAGLNLPELTRDIYEVQMTPKQRKLYVDLQRKLIAEIASELDNNQRRTVSTSHVLTKLLRLAQITSGHVRYDTDVSPDGEVTLGPVEQIDNVNPKIEALMDIIKQTTKSEKLIVWACFREDISAVANRLQAEGIQCRTYFGGTNDADRDEAVASFNGNPDVKVFIANPIAGGTGLNLLGYPPGSDGTPDDPGTNVTRNVYFSQGWSMTARSQSEKRSHRKGTRVPVRCTDIVVPNTVDEEIRIRVVEKRLDAQEIQDIKSVMERLLENADSLDD